VGASYGMGERSKTSEFYWIWPLSGLAKHHLFKDRPSLLELGDQLVLVLLNCPQTELVLTIVFKLQTMNQMWGSRIFYNMLQYTNRLNVREIYLCISIGLWLIVVHTLLLMQHCR